jgi:hypothetical protein
MKRLLSSLALTALLLAGCATSAPTVLRPASTNTVRLLVTNSVPVVSFTDSVDAAGHTNVVAATNLVTRVVTNVVEVVTPAVTYQEVKLPPLLTGAVQAAGAVAPVPWAGGAASLLVGAAGIVVGWVNKRRRDKALGEAVDWKDTAATLVGNVETLRLAALKLPAYTPQMDANVMRAIKTAQSLAGVKAKVHELVEQHTQDTLPS